MTDRVLASLDPTQIIYAVVAMKGPGELLRPMVYGTAFCVGPGIFLTAGHVLTNVAADGGTVAVAQPDGAGTFRATLASSVEVLPTGDVGLIAVMTGGATLLDWTEDRRPMLADVAAIGFPYAVTSETDPPAFKVTMRGFKGHVLTRTSLWKVPGRPAGYEVSCFFPKGMSGAPLLDAKSPIPDLQVVGMVLGSGEVEAFGETTRFGVALDIVEMRLLRSEQIIGGTLDDLRAAVLTGDEFQFTKHTPFTQWPRRRTK